MSSGVEAHEVPREVIELCRGLADKGYRAWVVGGCLRDLMLGRPASDWDLATDARPEQVKQVFPRVLPTGIAHGTVTVRHRGQSYEVTTLRGEGAYSDGRRPDSVSFVTSIEDDLARRDFTVNAMAYDPLSASLVDPFGGRADLEGRVLRAVGAARERFSEDGLRVLRAARFCATLEFELASDTEAAIAPTLDTFRKVSAERVRDEWIKALRAPSPSRAFAVMRRTGILAITCPELARRAEPRWSASLRALDSSLAREESQGDPITRLAALLWPAWEQVGAWLGQYRFSNLERERLLRLLQHASADLTDRPNDAALRRSAHTIGRPHLTEIGALSVTLAEAHHGAHSEQARSARALWERLRALACSSVPLSQKELAISGKDLMLALGIAPGPKLGELLHALLASVLEEPAENQPELLIARARALL